MHVCVWFTAQEHFYVDVKDGLREDLQVLFEHFFTDSVLPFIRKRQIVIAVDAAAASIVAVVFVFIFMCNACSVVYGTWTRVSRPSKLELLSRTKILYFCFPPKFMEPRRKKFFMQKL